jgi:precorrin-6A/cobalt-precorrin-6A reductase
MHDPEMHQVLPRLWLFAGTGEGPPLAEALLAMGWRVRLSLVSEPAQRAYAAHPRLEVVIGPVGGVASIAAALGQARDHGDAFSLVVDATHPFAQTISADLASACSQRNLELLRLQRPAPEAKAPRERIHRLAGLEELAGLPLNGAHLLLAIGHRHLAQAVAHTPGAIHHARLLPNAASLKVAMAAGLAAERVACLRPTPLGLPWCDSVEAGLLRRWQIEAILARASGGATEACWRSLASQLELQLILIQRPNEPADGMGLGQQALLAQAQNRLAQLRSA